MKSGEIKTKVKAVLGQYQVKISPKGRVAFPKKFRKILGERIILTRGYEGCLIAISETNWKTLTEATDKRPFVFGATRDTLRFLLGNAALAELDSQGRFVIPNHLRDYSQPNKEVIFLGLDRYVEIWAKEKWQEYQKYLDKNIVQISERLNETNGEGSFRAHSSTFK